jgi:hypothetical protein
MLPYAPNWSIKLKESTLYLVMGKPVARQIGTREERKTNG